jgi:asparagine synthase (glutamine-hydrolysing)
LARDRFGIKPLYYSFESDSGRLFFSSEIKSILHLKPALKQLNSRALPSYLAFRYPILNDTFFKRINSLEPGHFIEWKDGVLEKKCYWDSVELFAEQEVDRGEKFYEESLWEVLNSSVEMRMVADVPVGAFLSGGVDSSAVAALMALKKGPGIKTYTIGFNEPGFNEFEYARMISERYDIKHNELHISGRDYIHKMEKFISFRDSPLSVPNEIPLWDMSKSLKKDFTVVLSGEGADECLMGYGRIFRSAYDYRRMKAGVLSPVLKSAFYKEYGVDYFPSEIEHFMVKYPYCSLGWQKNLLNDVELGESFFRDVKKYFSYLFARVPTQEYENKISYLFSTVHLPGLLQRLDATTMAASVEGRVPFVDHRLVELAWKIPVHYKLRWNSKNQMARQSLPASQISENHDTPKWILKEIMKEYLPREVLYRKKMGFPVPLHVWFGGQFCSWAKEILLDAKTVSRGLYNMAGVQKLLMEDGVDRDDALKIWMLINFELFCRSYFD